MLESATLLACFGGLASLAAWEAATHRRNLDRIPHRIHVAGTRGKSSVTRLLAGALREAGIRTAAKTTGTLARLILPDGEEVPVFRPIGPNILEQMRIVRVASRMSVDALVIECMALKPELHWISESKMIRATMGIITNARADHLEVMGPTEADVARCLAGMTPVAGALLTAEERHLEILEEAARDRGTELVAVGAEATPSVGPEVMSGFGHLEHAENVAIALAAAARFGVDRETAIAGMWKAPPDPGALTAHEIDFFGRRVVFVNGFAANDPASTENIWNIALEKHKDVGSRIALFNLRADRPHRSLQLARGSDFWRCADRIILTGSGAFSFARHVGDLYDASRLVIADDSRPEEVFERVIEACAESSLVVGMGNIGGQGLEIVRYFRNRSTARSHTHA